MRGHPRATRDLTRRPEGWPYPSPRLCLKSPPWEVRSLTNRATVGAAIRWICLLYPATFRKSRGMTARQALDCGRAVEARVYSMRNLFGKRDQEFLTTAPETYRTWRSPRRRRTIRTS